MYERVLEVAVVGPATSMLDLGCGTGLLCRIAADRGARVTGIDQGSSQIERAAALVPEGAFDAGDLMVLPYDAATFDAVTCVQSIMHVTNPLRALREAARVARRGAPVVVTVWGPEEQCELRAFGEALSVLLPRRPQGQGGRGIEPPSLSQDGRLERLAGLAGLSVSGSGEVVCPFRYPDEGALLDSLLDSGLGQRALRVASPAVVRRTVLDGLASYRTTDGGYRLDNMFRYLVAIAPT